MTVISEAEIRVNVDLSGLKTYHDLLDKVANGSMKVKDAQEALEQQVKSYEEELARTKENTLQWIEVDEKLKKAKEELKKAADDEGKGWKAAAEEAKQLTKDEKDAAKEAEKTARQLDKLTRKAVTFLGQYFAIKKSISAVMGFAKEGEELSRMAQLSGTSAESIEKLGIALKNYGGSASSASSTLGKLNRQMEDLKFGKKNNLYQVAIQYGLDLNAKTPEDMLRNIAKRMEGMGSLQQVNMGRKLGLDDATIMMLQQGLEGVNRELEKAGKLTVFSKEDIENANKMNRAYREFQAQFEKIKAVITRDLLPIFQTLFERLGKLADYLREHPKLLKAIGITAAVVFGGLLFWLHPILFTIGMIAAGIALLIDDWAHWKETGEGALKPIWEWLEKIGGQFKGLFDDIVNLLKKWDDWAHTSEKLKGIWEGIKGLFNSIWNLVMKIMNGVGGVVAALMTLSQGGSMKDAWKAFKASVSDDEPEEKKGKKVIRLKGHIIKPKSSQELGQDYITMANSTPVNTMTPAQMTMMNNNNQEQNQSTIWNVGQVTVNQKNNESAQQTLMDWTANASPAY